MGLLSWSVGMTSMQPVPMMAWLLTIFPSSQIQLILTPPVISALSPANGATNVPLNTGATITFDEPVQKLTGNISIKRTADNSVFQTIDINSPGVNVSGAAVSFPLSGLNQTQVTISR